MQLKSYLRQYLTILRAAHRNLCCACFLKNLFFNLPNIKPRVGVNVPVPAAREAATRADPPDRTAKFTYITQWIIVLNNFYLIIPPLQLDLHGLSTLKLFLFLQSRSGSRSANGFCGFWPAATHKPPLSCYNTNVRYTLGKSCFLLYLLDYVFIYKTIDSIDFSCNISGRTAKYWE